MKVADYDVPGYPAAGHPVRLYSPAGAATARPLFVLAHGAGAGHLSRWMQDTASGLAARGLHVATFNFPYTQAGRRTPDRAPILLDAFRRVVAAARELTSPSRVAIGGKSMGGRMATHLASEDEGYAAAVAFGYPLNPPGPARRPQDRVSHLARLKAPLLIVQGTRDTFGGPDDLRAALPPGAPITIFPVDTGDHSLEVLKRSGRTQAEVDEEVWGEVVKFVTGV